MKIHFVVQKIIQTILLTIGIVVLPLYNLCQLKKEPLAIKAPPALKTHSPYFFLFGVDWAKKLQTVICNQTNTFLLKGIFTKSSGEQILILNINDKNALYQQSDLLFKKEKILIISGKKILVKNELTGNVSGYCLSEDFIPNSQKKTIIPGTDFQNEITSTIKTPFFTLEGIKSGNDFLGYKVSSCSSVCYLKDIELKNNDVILKINNQTPSKKVILEMLKKPKTTVFLLRNNQKLHKSIKLPHWIIKKIHNEYLQN